MTLLEIIEDMERAIAARSGEVQPARGMHVPYRGPLCSAPPSVLRDVAWWAKHLRSLCE